MRLRIAAVAVLSMICVSGSTVAWAQGLGGQAITGTVTDSSGAVVSDAKVVVVNLETGVKAEMLSNSEGLYRTAPLTVGQYQVSVSKQGFKTSLQSGIMLHLGTIQRIDVQLTLGSVADSIQVAATPPILETQDPRLSDVVEAKAVESLPLTDHQAGGLIQLGSGVFYQGEDALSFNAPRFNVAGGGDLAITLNGAGDSTPRTNVNQMVLNPPQESIQEVQIQTSYYSAQYGGAEGGLVRFDTKSGTNQFHGSLYELNRNTMFDSRQYFSPVKTGDHYNLFGGSVGGPIQKDKTFFFVNLDFQRSYTPSSGLYTVPTAAMRQGDFSALSTPIYDPTTTRPDPAHPGSYIRDPYPGNIIPAADLDPVGVNMASYWPDPNLPGLSNNLQATWSNQLNRNALVVRVDHQLTSKDNLSFVWNRSHFNFGSVNFRPEFKDPAALSGGFAYLGVEPSDSYVVSETHSFSARLINTMRFAWRPDSAFPQQIGDPTKPWGTTLGITNFYKDQIFPPVNPAGYFGLGQSSVLNRAPYPENSLEWADDVTFVRGKHTFGFGLQLQRSRNWGACGLLDTGSYNFDQRLTAQPGVANTGDSVASLLVGAVASASVSHCADTYFQEWYAAPYAQDNIRATSKLTLDFGIRWDMDFPVRDIIANQGSGFDPYQLNPVSGTPGVITFQGQPGSPYGFYRVDWTRFEPRAGFSYQPSEKTVIRGGYGIYGISPRLGSNVGAPEQGFDLVNSTFSTNDNGLTPAFYLQNGLPNYPVGRSRNPGFGAVPVGQSPITSPNFVDPNWKFGYSQNFNLSIQQELPWHFVVQVAGLGNLGRKLSLSRNINQLPPNLWGQTGNQQSVRPFPQFGNVTNLKYPEGEINYYGLTGTVTRRLSKGLLVIGSYTWQKSLGIVSLDSIYYPRRNYGPTVFQEANAPTGAPYKLGRLSWVYDLPVGPGQRFLTSGPASWILGNWFIGGIYSYASGIPFSLTNSTDSLNCFCNLGKRLDLVSSDLKGPQTLGQWFNTSAVASPAFGTVGNMGVGKLIGPSFNNLDLSFGKSFHLKERYGLKFELEMFNATNTTKFGLPGTTYGTSSFGKISSVAGTGSGTAFSPAWYEARIMQLSGYLTF